MEQGTSLKWPPYPHVYTEILVFYECAHSLCKFGCTHTTSCVQRSETTMGVYLHLLFYLRKGVFVACHCIHQFSWPTGCYRFSYLPLPPRHRSTGTSHRHYHTWLLHGFWGLELRFSHFFWQALSPHRALSLVPEILFSDSF